LIGSFWSKPRVLTPYQLQKLVTVFGVDPVVRGPDYPCHMTESDAISHVASVKTFDAATIVAIASANAKGCWGSKTQDLALDSFRAPRLVLSVTKSVVTHGEHLCSRRVGALSPAPWVTGQLSR
jgi:hypothetical protein